MFAMVVEDALEIEGRGIVLSGHYNSEKYSVCTNTCLYDMMGDEYVVSGIAMMRRIDFTSMDRKHYPIDILLKDLKGHDKNYFIGKLLTTQFDFCLLYPEDPIYPNCIDIEYRSESEKARKYALLNLELLMDNEVRVKNIEHKGKIIRMMYRGWMIPPGQYEILYNRLAENDVYLVNTPQQYRLCHCLPEWYGIMADCSPESRWTEDLSDKAIEQVLQQFSSNPIVVKDFVKSRKHEWYDACYIRDASDTESAKRIIHTFIERQGDSMEGGLVLRRYEQLVGAGYHPESGMPVSEEYRVFFFAGRLMIVSDYWSEAGPHKVKLNKDETAWIKSLAQRINSVFFTVDIARKTDGSLCVMELGDGQVSGLQGIKADFFYTRIYDILLSVNDICDFVELDGNIVASDTFEFKLPCGSITVSSSDGTKLPFSVERRSNISVYRVMDESGERLLKEFTTEDFYALAFDLPPDKGKKFSVVFSGGSLPSFDSDEYTFSIAGIIGEYAVGFAAYDTESDLFHGMDYKEYDVCINDAHNGYDVSPLMDKPVKALFYIACLKADEYPDEAVNAVEIWVN